MLKVVPLDPEGGTNFFFFFFFFFWWVCAARVFKSRVYRKDFFLKTRQFSNHESRLLSRAHTFAIIVILDLKIHQSICGYTDPFFQKL